MQILGHRGAMGLAPENTLKSFEKAIELGVDGIEFDVRLCDGELVVFHDSTLERCTNGKGRLKDISFSELRMLDAGEGEQVPTLAETCELIGEHALINIELKGRNTANPVMEYLLSEQNKIPLSQFLLSSFKYQELIIARDISQDIKLGVLAEEGYEKALQVAKQLDAYSFHPDQESVTPEYIIKARNADLKVFVFTVNEQEKFNQLKEWKVDGVFTDFPDLIRHSHESWNQS